MTASRYQVLRLLISLQGAARVQVIVAAFTTTNPYRRLLGLLYRRVTLALLWGWVRSPPVGLAIGMSLAYTVLSTGLAMPQALLLWGLTIGSCLGLLICASLWAKATKLATEVQDILDRRVPIGEVIEELGAVPHVNIST